MNDVLQDRGLVVISCGYSSGSRISGAATVLQSDTVFLAIFSSSERLLVHVRLSLVECKGQRATGRCGVVYKATLR